MKTIAFRGRTWQLDDHGFLDPPEQWDEDYEEGMARIVGLNSRPTARHGQGAAFTGRGSSPAPAACAWRAAPHAPPPPAPPAGPAHGEALPGPAVSARLLRPV